mgnify:CR=1 FL=1
MTISHGGYSFGSLTTHGLPIEGDWIFEDVTESYFGVQGVQQVKDLLKWREIRLALDVGGYSTFANLNTALDTLDSKINALSGTLTINGATYPHCVFKGFLRAGPSMYLTGPASGSGYMQQGYLVWRQLSK